MVKKAIRKKIIEKCRKITTCPYCKSANGFVQKLTASKGSSGGSVLKIIWEKSRGVNKETLIKDHIEKFSAAVENNPEIKNALNVTNNVSQILTPIDVLKLFERIPQSDIPLLAMDARKSQPKDLIFTRMLVPPVSIRPSVVSDLKAGT